MNDGVINRKCKHCSNSFEVKGTLEHFCCSGCRAAHSMITGLELDDFYNLSEKSVLSKGATFDDSLVEVFDEQVFNNKFCEVNGKNTEAKLHIDGLTCYACVWLIKKALEKKVPEAQIDISLSSGESRLNFSAEHTSLSSLVRLISSLGYSVRPSVGGVEQGAAKDLVRIGVSTFCFLNIMMFALPDYVDSRFVTERGFWQLFRWISFFLATIVIFYGAYPLLKTSWIYLRRFKITVDQPIMLALLIAYLYSGMNTFVGSGEIYFDSIAIVVTLLLTGRFFQKKIVQSAEAQVRGRFDLSMHYVKQQVGDKKKILPVNKLESGDGYYILPGDPVPVDSKVIKGQGEITYEQITGEAKPEMLLEGQIVRAGAVASANRFDLIAIESGGAGLFARMDTLLQQMLLEQGIYTKFSDKLGGIFFAFIILFSSSLLLILWSSSPEEAIRRTVAALLVACPCAFAIAVPLTMTKATALGLKNGIIFKTQKAIENLGRAKKVFFDKTGTLTYGRPEVIKVIWDIQALNTLSLSKEMIIDILKVLEDYSSHHVARAIGLWAQAQPLGLRGVKASKQDEHDLISDHGVDEFMEATPPKIKEQLGQGLIIMLDHNEIRLGRKKFVSTQDKEFAPVGDEGSTVFLGIDNKSIAQIVLSDTILPEAQPIIQQIKKLGMIPGIISGDGATISLSVAHSLGIDKNYVFSDATPFEKIKNMNQAVQKRDKTVMVGNGINDMLALAYADVGIAVGDASQKAKDSASICLLGEGLHNFLPAITLSQTALKKIKICFIFASSYNLIGLTLAAFGKINPAVAAVLMPISSVSVVIIASRWRLQKKGNAEWRA